jgi:calcineurin-like phosphoesterase family protein
LTQRDSAGRFASGQSIVALTALTSRKSQPKLDAVVRPLNIKVPKPVPRKSGGLITALLYGDTHFPHQDDAVLGAIRAIAEESQPDFVVHMGDLVDAYSLSRFDHNPERKETLQDEINMAREHLATMRLTCPDSRFLLLEGNHELRLQRTLWNLDGPASILASLTQFKKVMTWPVLLGLDELNVEFVPVAEQSQRDYLPKWLLKHGTKVRPQSSYTARAEWEQYGMSGSSGHTHRLGVFFHRDRRGNHAWVETGCSCSMIAEYADSPNWQQGCVFLTFEPETGAFQAETIYLHNGFGVFRGKTYGKRKRSS